MAKIIYFYSPAIGHAEWMNSGVLCKPGKNFLTYETEFVILLAVLENSVLPMG